MLSTTELYQLLKLPVLIEHYHEHKAQNEEMSFIDFLSLHYNQAFDHDNQDHKLPFKSHDSNICASLVAFVPSPFVIILTKPINFEERKISVFKPSYFSFSIVNPIWQPPKSC